MPNNSSAYLKLSLWLLFCLHTFYYIINRQHACLQNFITDKHLQHFIDCLVTSDLARHNTCDHYKDF